MLPRIAARQDPDQPGGKLLAGCLRWHGRIFGALRRRLRDCTGRRGRAPQHDRVHHKSEQWCWTARHQCQGNNEPIPVSFPTYVVSYASELVEKVLETTLPRCRGSESDGALSFHSSGFATAHYRSA